jgi:hypothetical protein
MKPEQRRPGTELHVRRRACAVQGLDSIGEAHGVANVTYPVLGRRHLAAGKAAAHVRDEGDGRRAVHDGSRDAPELREHRIHQRRVKRVRHDQPLAPDLTLRQGLGDAEHRLFHAGDHHR